MQDQTIPAQLHFAKAREHLNAIDTAFEKFRQAKEKDDAKLGVTADAVVDPAKRSVEYRTAYRTVTEPFGLVREYLESLPEKEPEHVLTILGDGEFIKHIREKLAQLQELLKEPIGTKDDRLERCEKACTIAEHVMQDGLMLRLKDAVSEKDNAKIKMAMEALFLGFLQGVDAAALDKDQMLAELNTEWEARNEKLKSQGRKSLGAMPEQEISKMISAVVNEFGV